MQSLPTVSVALISASGLLARLRLTLNNYNALYRLQFRSTSSLHSTPYAELTAGTDSNGAMDVHMLHN